MRDRLLIERYLQGKLSADEEREFEEAYLADPSLLNELVLTERLRDGLEDAASRGTLLEPTRSSGGAGSRWYAAAASLVAAVSLAASGWLFVENRSLRESSPAASANIRLQPLFAVRSADAFAVPIPPADEATVLLLDPGFGDFTEYRARLVRVAGGADIEVTSATGLTPTYEDLVALPVAPGALPAGDYRVELEGLAAGSASTTPAELVSRIAFTVTP